MARVYEDRRTELYDRLPDSIQSAAITPGPTLRYLTGYTYPQEAHGSTSPFVLVLSEGKPPAFVAPDLEAARAQSIIGAGSVVRTYTGSRAEATAAFEDLWDEYGSSGPVAVEHVSMRLVEHAMLTAGGVDKTVDVTDLVYDLRSRKDEEEISLLRRAASVTDDILRDVLGWIEPGMTEKEVVSALERRTVESDADNLGVTLVVSGARTAQVYTDTTDRVIEDGDLVLVDTGVVYEGYYTDVTRTVVVGDASPEQREMYDAVRRALNGALDAVTGGVTCAELDAVAREHIVDAGYGEKFVTTLGHGFGLEPHEPPSLRAGNEAPIEVGHVFTIEPGVYVEGTGGIRIEDNVVLTADGPEVLTQTSHTFEL